MKKLTRWGAAVLILLATIAAVMGVTAPVSSNPGEVALRSVGVSPGGNDTCVIVKPVGLAVGDLMIAHMIFNFYDEVPTATVPPGDWTEIRQDSGNYMRTALFWKIADQDDVNASDFTFTSNLPYTIGAISAWTGHNALSPINAHNGQYNSGATTVTSPAITPSVANCVILMLCGVGDDNTQSGYAIATNNPASWTEAYDISTTEGPGEAVAMGYAVRPETTSTGLGTATSSASDNNIGQLVAIAPAAVAAPTVTTQAVSDIADTTATGNGNITDNGGEDASAWGVCYNTTGNPTTADSTAAGTGSGGTGAFTASMTSLTPGEHYYVKAYATNTGGTGYGSQVEFTTKGPPSVTTSAATLIEETTATLNSNITSVNDGSCSVRGFDWDIDTGAPYANNWNEVGTYGTGIFDRGITSLAKGELYYFRAYATNIYGTGYGTELTFLTKPDAPFSLLATATADGVITLTWSKGSGAQNTYVRGKQGSYPTDRADGYLVYNDTGTTDTDTGLTGGLLYYYRAWSYATEGGKEQYSDAYDEDYSVAIEAPSITTNTPTDVGNTYATLQANMTSTGGSLADYRGFVWDTTTRGDPGNTAPAVSDYVSYNTTSGSYDTGAFTHSVTTLVEGTPYYVRGCAHNTMGWSYGSEISFSTREEVLYFQPSTMISGTILPDRAGDNDGTITWGSNPAGVSVEVGGLEATGVTAEITTEEPTTPDYVDDTPAVDMFTETTGENIPVFYPIFKFASDTTGLPIQIFWITGAIVIAVVVGAIAMMFLHSMLIAGFASGAIVLAACSMEVLSWWVLYIYIIMAACFWVYQRMASV